ncbi:TFIIB-type zinc ribbon-containing protein [Nioella nitratireducens]|uniref:TFIIB-type zinc ribbon-containing protein n=1 Tax=Nioella nitratireducens TaxID=1287720 RepID=UPI0008FD67EB|nr:zf-TFIIB domain-containing protein [Nioella nitratireducens]
MQCPIDGTALVIADRAGVEIDYCPTCRGVWLDRGELDKIVERSALADDRRDDGREAPSKRKKKDGVGSFLSDIFDF